MAHRFRYPGISIKEEIWICNRKEADAMRQRGIPYLIVSSASDEEIAKAIVYSFCLKRYPHLLIGKVPRTTLKIEVAAEYREDAGDGLGSGSEENNFGDYIQYTEGGEYRESGGGASQEIDLSEPEYSKVAFKEFFDPSDMSVDMDVLAKMGMLPKFAIDIMESIELNLLDYMYQDGWNKKLGMHTGFFGHTYNAPNLIILDVSGSIPRGVSATMVALIETLCHRANAHLIVTSGSSFFYDKDHLPTPEQLSHIVGGGNEQRMFYTILEDKILGRHWGNVIVFGDQDCPAAYRGGSYVNGRWGRDKRVELDKAKLAATKVDHLMSFHTYAEKTPGYGLWCHGCQLGSEEIDTSWVRSMKLSPSERRWLNCY